MKTTLYTLLFFFFGNFMIVNAQISIDSVFYHCKSSKLDLLSLNMRMDMLDYFNSGIKMGVENNFSEKSLLHTKSNKVLKLNLSEVSDCEIILSPNVDTDSLYVLLYVLKQPKGKVQWEVRKLDEYLLNSGFLEPNICEYLDKNLYSEAEINTLNSCGWIATYSEKDGVFTVELAKTNLFQSVKDKLREQRTKLVYKWEGKMLSKMCSDINNHNAL